MVACREGEKKKKKKTALFMFPDLPSCTFNHFFYLFFLNFYYSLFQGTVLIQFRSYDGTLLLGLLHTSSKRNPKRRPCPGLGVLLFPPSFISLRGNLGRLTLVRLQQAQEQSYPFLTVPAVFLCVQTRVWLPVLGIFNMHTDVSACDGTRGVYRHCNRVCAES